MAIWKWLTGRLNVTSDLDKWRMMWGFDHDSGQNVTPDSAMKLSTWWAAKRLISETISTLPAGVFATASNDQRTARKDHRLYEILQITPNADQTAVEFWEGRIAPLCDFGNSYAEKKFIGDRLVALQPMKAENTTPLRDSSDRLFYRFNDRGKNEDLPKDKVFHIKGFAPTTRTRGFRPSPMPLVRLAQPSRRNGRPPGCFPRAFATAGSGSRRSRWTRINASSSWTITSSLSRATKARARASSCRRASIGSRSTSRLAMPN
ncbi:phage portal protein [Mesorhizobium sp. M7A.F.Ca.CA.004.12.1.1]|nr:phage portal protein [Mesorhizobium sp. M7A.F.Ca.CA.004.12.1.1]